MNSKLFLIYFSFFFCIFNHQTTLAFEITPRETNSEKNRQCDVAIAAIFQNEAPFIKEWIEFHKLIGVKHFYLYNNFSQDDFESVLKPYINSGEVELFDVLENFTIENYDSNTELLMDWRKCQQEVYNHAISLSRNFNKWVAFIDSDEFIALVDESDLYKFLQQYEFAGGIVINWLMFGTSNVYDLSSTDLLIEKLIFRAPLDWHENKQIKSIVRPKFVQHCIDAHTFKYVGNVFAVHPNKQKYSHNSKFSNLPVEKIRLNHYWYRTEKYYYDIKRPRRSMRGDKRSDAQILKHLKSLNSIEDNTMMRFVPKLKKVMNK